jgi:hypothetical protein
MNQQTRMMKQMIDFQRMTVDGVINNMIIFWDQTGNMMNAVLDQAAWLPEEAKRPLRQWVDTNKKGCESFREAVCSGYNNLEKMMGSEVDRAA